MLVLFGTGQYLADGDITSNQTQSFYGVWDDGNQSGMLRKDLVEQQADVSSDPDNRFPSNDQVNYTSNNPDRGWFMDLPESGERLVTRPKIREDIVLFNTTIPSTDACEYGGSGWEMALKVVNGGRPNKKQPVIDLNSDGGLNQNDLQEVGGTKMAAGAEKFTHGMPTAPSTLGENKYTAGSATQSGQEIEKDKLPPVLTKKTGRMSWQELLK
jgi:type IV pilus assembly protein PilY1